MQTIRYQEWSEEEQKITRLLQEVMIPDEEIFVRKLVNATVIRNQLYEHTSHESEDMYKHQIYAKPYSELDMPVYGQGIIPPLSEYTRPSMRLEPEFLYWDGSAFRLGQSLFTLSYSLDIAKVLLDHYISAKLQSYECVYTVLDTNRNKVLFYLKEVNE